MNDISNEKCVLCGKDSGIPEDTPVSERRNYVKGCGQLCGECFFKLYHNPDSENTVSDEEMQRLLELSCEEII